MFRQLVPPCLVLLVLGCARQPAPATPPVPLTEGLVGLSIEDLKARLGPPDSETKGDRPFDFGCNPKSLAVGDPYTYLFYADYQGEQVHVFLVAPELYQRIKGRSPGDKELHVLEVFTFPKGTVF